MLENFLARAAQDFSGPVFGDRPPSPDRKSMAYFELRGHRGDNPNATALIIRNLRREEKREILLPVRVPPWAFLGLGWTGKVELIRYIKAEPE